MGLSIFFSVGDLPHLCEMLTSKIWHRTPDQFEEILGKLEMHGFRFFNNWEKQKLGSVYQACLLLGKEAGKIGECIDGIYNGNEDIAVGTILEERRSKIRYCSERIIAAGIGLFMLFDKTGPGNLDRLGELMLTKLRKWSENQKND